MQGVATVMMIATVMMAMLSGAGSSESVCPDNRCCRKDAAEYIRLCRAVRQHCVPQAQPGGVCSCDVDGSVPARDLHNASGPKILVDTGRPGCARHVDTWNHHGAGEFCYVQYDCDQDTLPTHDWSNIKWRRCSTNKPKCPSECQAALDEILTPGTIKDCITDSATRQVSLLRLHDRASLPRRALSQTLALNLNLAPLADPMMRCVLPPQSLCADLDGPGSLGDAVAVDSDSPTLNGVHYTSMQYFRVWGALGAPYAICHMPFRYTPTHRCCCCCCCCCRGCTR